MIVIDLMIQFSFINIRILHVYSYKLLIYSICSFQKHQISVKHVLK